MNESYNCERRPRKGYRLRWTGDNTDDVFPALIAGGMSGELCRVTTYMKIISKGDWFHTIKHGDWVLKGEDGHLRFYDDEKMQLMYRGLIEPN